MTTPNVNAQAMMPVGGQEITSGKAKGDREDQSFMDVLSIADSAARVKAPEQKADAGVVQSQSKAPKEVKQADPKDVNKDTSKDDSKDVKDASKADKTDKKTDTAEKKVKDNTKMNEAAEDVKDAIKDDLDITDEELNQVMETLGLTNADLLDPKTIPDIVAEVKDVTPVDIVSDEALTETVTNLQGTVREITSDLVQEMDITPEELKNTLAELKNEYEVVSPEPEIGSEAEIPTGIKENTKDFSEVLRDSDEIPRSPEQAVRTPAEAVKTEEPAPDRTERISDEGQGRQEEVSLNVTVKDEAKPGNQQDTGSEADTSQDDILRSGGRARHMEARTETAVNNENIFFQNLNTAVEETLEAAAATETTPTTTMVDAMDLINQIQGQIRAVVDSETQSLSMQLHPQSLGRLNVELVAKAGQLTAQFEAENASVKAALETRIVELREALEQRGVRVESVEVTVASHEFEQNLMGGEQSGQASGESNGRPGSRTRSINLNDLEGLDGIDGEDITEEERITRDMMAANGNSVDYTA